MGVLNELSKCRHEQDAPPFAKPAIDDSCYRLVELPNGLRAVLVSDPTADKAAAACDVSVTACGMSSNLLAGSHPWRSLPLSLPRSLRLQVRVGSLSDPTELAGLAHFSEHMLFYRWGRERRPGTRTAPRPRRRRRHRYRDLAGGRAAARWVADAPCCSRSAQRLRFLRP